MTHPDISKKGENSGEFLKIKDIYLEFIVLEELVSLLNINKQVYIVI